MGNCPDDKAEAFDGAARFAGQADYQSCIDDGGEVSREDRVLGDLHGFDAHDFAEAREFANGDLADGFRGDIAQGNSGTASG